ncbi:MAG: ribonuclease Z [Clostridia bacterium]|nr:ribonuclease Z [Clostridia bacterium]
MILFICIDEKDGMLFGGRRQSKDRALRERMLQLASSSRLFVNFFSAKQFEEKGFVLSEDPLGEAKEGDFVFLEDLPLPEKNIEKIVLYQWNRRYPADRFFDRKLLHGRKKTKTTDFVGSSHEKITEEIWE